MAKQESNSYKGSPGRSAKVDQKMAQQLQQLKQEIESQSWLISKLDNAKILSADTEELWANALREMGKEQALFANFPEDPNLN